MTCTGELTDESGELLLAFDLPQIVPANDARFQALQNGILPNTTLNWTRTEWNNKDGGPFSIDLKQLIFVRRGSSLGSIYPQSLPAAHRESINPFDCNFFTGFRVGVVAVPQGSSATT